MPAAEGSQQAAVGEVELEKLCHIHASALVVERVDNQCVHGQIGKANGRGKLWPAVGLCGSLCEHRQAWGEGFVCSKGCNFLGRLVDLPFAREVQSPYQIKIES